MNKLLFLSFSALFSFSVFSMPCDTVYSCKSESGKYQVELQRCRYVNSIRLITVKIDGKEVADTALNSGWDGDTILAFEINLPTKNEEDLRVLSVETKKLNSSTNGIAQEKVNVFNPGPSSVEASENIVCEITE